MGKLKIGIRLAAIAALLAALLPLSSPRAAAADEALIAAARKEGKVVWYTTLIVNQAIRPLVAAFEKKYPGVELQFARADEGPTAVKIMAEARAGQVQADVFDGVVTAASLKQAGLLAPYVPPAAAQDPADLKDKDGYWTAIVMFVFTPGINTSMVSTEQRSKTYQDLLDPRWKGKMAWNPSSIVGAQGFIGNALMTMGEAKGMDYLRALAKQQIVNVEASSRSILDQVIAGDYPMGLMMLNNHAVISAQKGAPVAWFPLEPVPYASDNIGLLKGALHPNAAKLLIDFVTSEDGQKVLQQASYLPVLPSVPAMDPTLRPEDGKYKANFLNPDVVQPQLSKWIEITNQLFR